MTTTPEKKQQIRARVRAAIATLSPEQRREKSYDITKTVLASDFFARAQTILFYAPTPEEADVMPVARAALDAGKRVCFPRVEWDTYGMHVVALDSLDEDAFAVRRHAIREPVGGAPIEPDELNLVLVPGVAFSTRGDRVGHGAGFYDRFLRQSPATRLGVCFSEQIDESVQGEDHDVPMEAIVTDGRDIIIPTDAQRDAPG
jgi:5-formyltetrahydrofolate cyclo-ligase